VLRAVEALRNKRDSHRRNVEAKRVASKKGKGSKVPAKDNKSCRLPFDGLVICITGTLSIARKDASAAIMEYGGTFSVGLTRKCVHT
jgi:BRCT domain type II-containing protein